MARIKNMNFEQCIDWWAGEVRRGINEALARYMRTLPPKKAAAEQAAE